MEKNSAVSVGKMFDTTLPFTGIGAVAMYVGNIHPDIDIDIKSDAERHREELEELCQGIGVDPSKINYLVRDEVEHGELIEYLKYIKMGIVTPSEYFYRSVGLNTTSLGQLYSSFIDFPVSEPVSPVERKKRYKEGLHKMMKKGKKW